MLLSDYLHKMKTAISIDWMIAPPEGTHVHPPTHTPVHILVGTHIYPINIISWWVWYRHIWTSHGSIQGKKNNYQLKNIMELWEIKNKKKKWFPQISNLEFGIFAIKKFHIKNILFLSLSLSGVFSVLLFDFHLPSVINKLSIKCKIKLEENVKTFHSEYGGFCAKEVS